MHTARRAIASPCRSPVRRAANELLEFFAPRAVVCADANAPIVADEVDPDHLAREQPLAARQDLVEHRRGIGDRAADRREHFARGALLLERLLRLVEQPHVLERDRRLVAERLQQSDLLFAERPHVLRGAAGSSRTAGLRGTAA